LNALTVLYAKELRGDTAAIYPWCAVSAK